MKSTDLYLNFYKYEKNYSLEIHEDLDTHYAMGDDTAIYLRHNHFDSVDEIKEYLRSASFQYVSLPFVIHVKVSGEAFDKIEKFDIIRFCAESSNENDELKETGKSTPPDRQRIGSRIKEIRKSKGMTQAQLADATGVNQSSISYIEDGTFSASLDVLAKISDALGCKIDIVK